MICRRKKPNYSGGFKIICSCGGGMGLHKVRIWMDNLKVEFQCNSCKAVKGYSARMEDSDLTLVEFGKIKSGT